MFDFQRFPFDWSNPFGYLIAIILEYIITAYIYVIIACTLSLAIDGYWFAYAATNEFQRFLPLINEKAQANANESNELTLLLSESLDAQGLVKKSSLYRKFYVNYIFIIRLYIFFQINT